MFLLTARLLGTVAASGVADALHWKIDSIPQAL
jgi:hypothetical protein